MSIVTIDSSVDRFINLLVCKTLQNNEKCPQRIQLTIIEDEETQQIVTFEEISVMKIAADEM